MAKPDDNYGTYGSVPTVMPSGGGASYASPNAFGAQVGAAMQNLGGAAEKFGDQQMQFATKVAQQATESKVNDEYANGYVPAVTELKNKYDQLQGQDKVHGYDAYIQSVHALNNDYRSKAKTPYEQQLWGGLTNKHLISETESAKRELVQSQIEYSNQAMTDRVKAEAGIVSTQKYNDPASWENFAKSVHSMFTMKAVDDGADPNHPETKETVLNASREAVGAAAVQGISSAMSRGDAVAANKIRQNLAPAIPGYQIPAIDASLHTENMRQTGTNGAKALIAGAPLPHAVGAPAAHVQALMANTAVKHGVNPNDALTLVRIESNNGQNVGTRGDIGQTGKGGSLEQQADNALVEWKKSTKVADNVFGQKAPAWATYICYQQGAGGGPALFNADPKARAIDVLAPLYKNAKQARDAICKNGGNSTMSCGDFLNYWQKRFEQNAKHAAVDLPESLKGDVGAVSAPADNDVVATQPDLGAAIMKPHEETGETVQPAANPRGNLANFDAKLPDMMARANAIPNYEVRDAVVKNLKQERADLQFSATAYSSQLINQAQKIAQSPTFTDISQVPSDLMTSLLDEHPETAHYLQVRADQNALKANGGADHDMKEYGSGYWDAFRAQASGEITSPTQLMAKLPDRDGKGGTLTMAGYDKLVKNFTDNPLSANQLRQQTNTYDMIKKSLMYEDESIGLKDPKGQQIWSNALPLLDDAVAKGLAAGKSYAQLTSHDSPDYIGNAVKSLKRTPAQIAIDQQYSATDAMNADDKAPVARTLRQILSEHSVAKTPEEKAALRKEAEDLGFVRRETAPESPVMVK